MNKLIKKEILEQKIKELRPWAHQIIFPYGLVADTPPYTGEVRKYEPYPKFVRINETGVFDDFLPPDKILDLGCSTGFFSIHFAQLGFNVTAIDNFEKNIEQISFVKEVYELNNLNIIQADIKDINLIFKDYNLILLLGVIHHLKENDVRLNLLKRCYDGLKKNGIIIIETKPQIPCFELLQKSGFVPIKLKAKKSRDVWKGTKV